MPDKLPTANPVARQGTWYYVRHVPPRLASIEQRKQVIWSSRIPVWQDPRGIHATVLIRQYDEALRRFWKQKIQGTDATDPSVLVAAKQRAQQLGLVYLPQTEIVTLDVDQLCKHLMTLVNTWGLNALTTPPFPSIIKYDVRAVCGSIPEPQDTAITSLLVSQMLEKFREINATILSKKSPNQLRKLVRKRQSALDLFIKVIGGDRPFVKLTRTEGHLWRRHFQSRVENNEIRINSANRDMRQVSGMYSAVRTYLQIDTPHIFEDLIIPGGEEGSRIPFDPLFVQTHYLAEGKFDHINPQARRLIYLIIETGLRLSEACALTRKTIHLDAPIPYVEVLADGRATKTPGSKRKIPLVGVALMAMREQPDGFPRYRDNADAASAVINDAITKLNLRPGGKDQTLYSMRHTIVDRLKAVEAPGEIQEDMLGHKHQYGQGTSLEHRHRWLEKIAFQPPSRV